MDELINDKDADVRLAVAMNGYGLEELSGDSNNYVRAIAMLQGYGIEKGIYGLGKD